MRRMILHKHFLHTVDDVRTTTLTALRRVRGLDHINYLESDRQRINNQGIAELKPSKKIRLLPNIFTRPSVLKKKLEWVIV